MLKRTLLASSVALVFLGACGDTSDDDTDFDDAGLPLAEVPEAYGAVFCNVTSRCNPFVKAYIPADDCVDYFISTMRAGGWDEMVDAVEDGRAVYNGDKMQACLDELNGRSCEELDDPEPESCEEATTGSVERGGDCTTDIECEGDSICQFSDSCPGTCSGKLNAGEACSGDDQCEEGLDCSDDTHRCVAPAQEGEDCDGGVAPPCAGIGLFCLGEDEDEDLPGTCRPIDEIFTAEPGDTCSFETGPLCVDGSACALVDLDPVSFECTEIVAEGEECQFGLPNACEAGTYCAGLDLAAADVTGTCEPYADAGDECDPDALLMCGIGASCEADDSEARCVSLKENGVGCEADDECWSDNCVDGGCAPEGACSD